MHLMFSWLRLPLNIRQERIPCNKASHFSLSASFSHIKSVQRPKILISPLRHLNDSISEWVRTADALFAVASLCRVLTRPPVFVFVWRCCARLQHLPHHERGPALPGRAVRRRQWVLPEPTQRHPERRHFLRLRRSVCAQRFNGGAFTSAEGDAHWSSWDYSLIVSVQQIWPALV